MKPIYLSKTVWFNVVATLVMIAELTQQMHPELIQYTAMITGVCNILLRVWFTNQAIDRGQNDN